MRPSLQVLDQNRDALLLAEIGALLHDLGKLSADLGNKAVEHTPPNDTHAAVLDTLPAAHPLITVLRSPAWQSRLTFPFPRPGPPVEMVCLADFLDKHHESQKLPDLVKILAGRGADGADSGIDKGALPETRTKQRLSDTWLATACGWEATRVDVGVLQASLNILASTLADLCGKVLNNDLPVTTARPLIFQYVETAYRLTLGETRRAANDVTLWDHSYSVASLYKAALAKLLLEGKWTEPPTLQWRILRIAIDGLGFLGQTHQVADILGRQEALRQALDAVRTLLEVAYPLGNEVYRDENGSAFVAPDVDDLLDLRDEQDVPLGQRIQNEFTATGLAGEAQLVVEPADLSQPTRGAIRLGELLRHPIPPLAADPQTVASWWPQPPTEDICTVCGQRPQGYGAEQVDEYRRNPRYYQQKAAARNVCCVCLSRRGRRAQAWACDALHTTIWTDEVADEHGRLALIVGQFDLEHWLDGRYLNSIFTQALAGRNGAGPTATTYDDLLAALADELRRNVKPDTGNPPWLQRLAPEAFRAPAQQFYQAVVEERDLDGLCAGVAADDWDAKAHLLALFLLRKHPSFARLRRIWETTRGFWQAVQRDDLPLAGTDRLRLCLEVQEKPNNVGDFHAYELNLGQAALQVVWDPTHRRFLTAVNLDYLAQQLPDRPARLEGWRELLTRQPFGLEEPTGYGGANRSLDMVTITSVESAGAYTPAIPILAEPRTFLALAPANQAPAVLQAIQDRYARELGKVRNRLPLTLGLVACPRRTPLRAVVEAGRRLLDQPTGPESWTVHSQNHGVIHFANGVEWHVPITLGDGSCDPYYPYFFVQADDARVQDRPHRFRSFRPTANGPESCWLVHANELKAGDEVYVTPSTFDCGGGTVKLAERGGPAVHGPGFRNHPLDAGERPQTRNPEAHL